MKKLKLIWIVGNLVVVGKYYWDSVSINCEPCPPNVPCPPCQTEFMSNFWLYLISWNLIGLLIFWAIRKKSIVPKEKVNSNKIEARETAREKGRELFESVPRRSRPGWGVTLLQAFEDFIESVPESVKGLYEIAENENDWNLAHAQFSLIRKYSLTNRNFHPESYLILAEKVAKITYNESGRDAPFDADSGWYISELARQTAAYFNSQELNADIERILTVNMKE